jgi:signal transduction protein with GAF and PtsI domain
MSSGAVARVKWTVRSFAVERAQRVLSRALRLENAAAVRNLLNDELRRAGLGELVLA